MGKEGIHLSTNFHLFLAEGYFLVHQLLELLACWCLGPENALRRESQGISQELCRHVLEKECQGGAGGMNGIPKRCCYRRFLMKE